MLFDETLIELFDIDIGFIKIFYLTYKKMVCSEEKWHFSTSAQILKSVYMSRHTI